ncbi:MAG: MFS transporter [Caldilineaceae bacterium]
MHTEANNTPPAPQRLNLDFWKFWTGQTISNLGSSFTAFALPLLIYKLTGSALNLAFASAAAFLPYLLFGLVIGAWVDRLNRKRLMIAVDLINALIIASIPLLAMADRLSIWWIYAVGFIASTIGIAFQSAEFAAIPSLVSQDDLVTANGRIQASYSAAAIIGPLLAGVLVAVMPLYDILFFDACSFVVSALSLALIRRGFNTETTEERTTSIRQDVVEGLRYVISHPVLRNISLMMALVNFFGSTANAQLVLFAQQRLHATDAEVGYLYSAGSVGIVLLSLAAGLLRKRWSFSTVALGALMISGIVQIVFALTTGYWLALVLWSLYSGLGILFNINTGSLRQAIVPNHMLGRVMSIAGVLAWSAIPIGTFLGGLAIEKTGDVALVYLVIGIIVFLIPLCFWFTPLGHADRYLPKPEMKEEQGAQPVTA